MTSWARALAELEQFEPVTAVPLDDDAGMRRLRAEIRKKGDGNVHPMPYPNNEVVTTYK